MRLNLYGDIQVNSDFTLYMVFTASNRVFGTYFFRVFGIQFYSYGIPEIHNGVINYLFNYGNQTAIIAIV